MERKKYQLTATKVEDLKHELSLLSTKGRDEIAERFVNVQDQVIGELEDPFSSISEDKFFLEKRIAEIQEILENVEIVEEHHNNKIVEIGSEVRVGQESFENVYTIVESIEADPLTGKISCESPVGKALLGAKLGDILEITTGPLKIKIRILEIN
jgi:transcription elongation factor GreA